MILLMIARLLLETAGPHGCDVCRESATMPDVIVCVGRGHVTEIDEDGATREYDVCLTEGGVSE